jgi:hypothetical protein
MAISPDPPPVEPAVKPLARLRPLRRPLLVSLVLLALLAVQTVAGDGTAAAVRHADATFERALAAFAVSRAINAVISVIQEAEVGVSLVAVNAGLQPGQVLDPVNDLVERFSLVMLAAAALSLALKLACELILAPVLVATLLAVLAATAALGLAPAAAVRELGLMGLRLVTITLIVLVAITAIPHASHFLHERAVIQESYQQSSAGLGAARERLETIHQETPRPPVVPEEGQAGERPGILGQIGDTVSGLTRGASGLFSVDRLYQQAERARATADAVSRDIVAQITIFLLEVALLPLLVLYVMTRWLGGQLRG